MLKERNNSLRLFSGVSGTRIATLCGSDLPEMIFANTTVVKVEFATDGSVGKSGFHLSFIAGRSTAPSTPIMSPAHGNLIVECHLSCIRMSQ